MAQKMKKTSKRKTSLKKKKNSKFTKTNETGIIKDLLFLTDYKKQLLETIVLMSGVGSKMLTRLFTKMMRLKLKG